jgi:uncharacterized protein YndB with AHSA1/START domain
MSSPRTASSRELVIERIFDAPRDLVFEVWTHPKHLANWWGPKDFTLPHCEIEFRVGGYYRFCMCSPEGDKHWVSGVYRQIVTPELIEKTWRREYESGEIWCDTLLSLVFEDLNGQTKFRLQQTGFIDPEHLEKHRGGWGQCIERLGEYVQVA